MAINWMNAPAMWYRGTGSPTSSSARDLGNHHNGLFAAVSNTSSAVMRFGADPASRSGWVYGAGGLAGNSPVLAVNCPPLATRHFGGRLIVRSTLYSNERLMFAVRDESYDSGVIHLSITTDAAGTIRIRRGNSSGTVVATSAENGWLQGSSGRADFWSVDATIHDSLGSCTVYRNGEEVVSFAGDTRNGGAGTIGAIAWYLAMYSTNEPAWFLEDLYYGDSSGSTATTALPDLAVDVLDPDGDGDVADGTPNTGTPHAAVNEEATVGIPDGDGTYVELDPGEKHLFTFGNLAGAPSTIYGVQHNTLWKRTDAGAITARQVIKSGGVEYEDAAEDPGVTYSWQETLRTVDPATGMPWTPGAVSALQAGVEYP